MNSNRARVTVQYGPGGPVSEGIRVAGRSATDQVCVTPETRSQVAADKRGGGVAWGWMVIWSAYLCVRVCVADGVFR